MYKVHYAAYGNFANDKIIGYYERKVEAFIYCAQHGYKQTIRVGLQWRTYYLTSTGVYYITKNDKNKILK